jgi:hypothetical protein
MAFPKMVQIGIMRFPVDSWEELKDAYAVFGSDVSVVSVESRDEAPRRAGNGASSSPAGLSATDRTLLEQFVEAGSRGVLTSSIGQALGKRGKGIRPALEGWSRRVGLVTEEAATAFETVKRFDGRGYRMVDHYLRAASGMLGR